MRYDPNRLHIVDEDDYLEFVDRMKTDASTFTDNYIAAWNKVPYVDDFIEEYPIYDREIIYPEIAKHISKIAEIVQKEKSNGEKNC